MNTQLVAGIVIALIVGAIIGFGIGYVTLPAKTTTVAGGGGGLSGEIDIGLAIAVSGGYSVDGPRRLKGAQLAIKEFNEMLKAAGAPFYFKGIHEDTGSKPEGAVNVINRFASLGIKVVVGPLSTSETKAVMPIANEKKIVVISPSSTGAGAALPNDYVFRMPPPDTAQGKAIAHVIYDLGYKKVAVIARDDDYGRGLTDLFTNEFEGLGGTVKKILYQPNQPDYSTEVNQLSTNVQNFGAGSDTAVLIIAFDTDGGNILEHASTDPVLSSVKWFGPDSMKRKTFLPPDAPESVGQFLIKTNFTVFAPAIARNPITEHFEQAYKNEYGEDPTPYAYYAYDATWIAMLTITAVGKYDGEAVKNMLPNIAAHFIGATGHKLLDKNGDAAFADYGISIVSQSGGTYSFEEIGIWHSSTSSVEWYKK